MLGDPDEINARIGEFMKDFLQRKVNVANSFTARGARLLEQLPQVVRTEPLKYVGTMLDASAKIYAMRVDNTYGECYTVRTNIEEAQLGVGGVRRRKKGPAPEELSEDAEAEEGGDNEVAGTSQQMRSTIARAGRKQLNAGRSFITADLAKINRPTEAYSITDPIYQKAVRQVEEAPAGTGFLASHVPRSVDGKWLLLHTGWPEDQMEAASEPATHTSDRPADWDKAMSELDEIREMFEQRLLGPDPCHVPWLKELCSEADMLHINGGYSTDAENRATHAKRQRRDETRAQSVVSAATAAPGSSQQGSGEISRSGTLYLLTRFSPLIDTLWHAEVKVARVSDLQPLGLFRHGHNHGQWRHHGDKRKRAQQSPFKIPNAPNQVSPPSPRKRHFNSDRSPTTFTLDEHSSQPPPSTAAGATSSSAPSSQRDHRVLFWSRPRSYPQLYPGQVVNERPMEKDPLVCKPLVKSPTVGIKIDEEETSLAASRETSQAPTTVSTLDVDAVGSSPTKSTTTGVDDFVTMHQPLSTTMMFMDDEVDDLAAAASSASPEKETVLRDSPSPTPAAENGDAPHDDHWLGDPNRTVDDAGAGANELGCGMRRRGRREEAAGGDKRELAKGKKPRKAKRIGRKNAGNIVQKRVKEMSWLPRSLINRDFHTSTPLPLVPSEMPSSSHADPSSNYTLGEERHFSRAEGTNPAMESADASYNCMDFLSSGLFTADENGCWRSCSDSLGKNKAVFVIKPSSNAGDEATIAGFRRVYQAFRDGDNSILIDLNAPSTSTAEHTTTAAGPSISAAAPQQQGPLDFDGLDDDIDVDMDDGASMDSVELIGKSRLPRPADDEELQFNGGVIRVRQARIRAPLVKKALAHILSSPELDVHSLEALRAEYAELFTDNAAMQRNDNESSSASDGSSDGEESGEEDDRLDAGRRNEAPPHQSTPEQANGPATCSIHSLHSPTATEIHRSERALRFPLRGEHTLQSVLAQLPSYLHGGTRQDLNVQNAFSVALHMCNERGLCLEQAKDILDGTVTKEGMKNFAIREARTTSVEGIGPPSTSTSSAALPNLNVTVRRRRAMKRILVIESESEEDDVYAMP